MDIVGLLGMCLVVAMSFVCTDCRQMCLSCQFQSTVPGYPTAIGKECMTSPRNWTGAEIRIKCPTMCIIKAIFDKETNIPTFFLRGCQSTDRKNGCIKAGLSLDCLYSCGNGNNYCNDATDFKIKLGLDKDGKVKDKDDEDEKDNSDDMAASLYSLFGLIAVCSVGFYIKKNCCSNPEDDEKEEEEEEEDGVENSGVWHTKY